eukprot:5182-Heterococcus_DN1.PRE.2
MTAVPVTAVAILQGAATGQIFAVLHCKLLPLCMSQFSDVTDHTCTPIFKWNFIYLNMTSI